MAEITIDEVTSGTIEGFGAFDEIMKAAQVRLNHEYEKDRIKGTEYSKVYLGSMEQAMQQSIAFVLGRQQASAQADLLIQQGELVAIEIFNAKKNGELIDQQILKSIAEIEILGKELLIMDSKILLAEAQVPKIKAETAVLEQQVINMVKQNEKLDQDILASKEQVKLIKHQVYAAEAQINDTYNNPVLVEGQVIPVGGILKGQTDKINEEAELLRKKGNTEQSNYLDITDVGPVTGTVGKQKEVYDAQIAHFTDDVRLRDKKLEYDLQTAEIAVNNEVGDDIYDDGSIKFE